VCLGESIAIGPDMTAGELHDRMALVGAGLVVKALAALERGSMDCRPQPQAGVTYARKITNEEARIDFGRPAREVHNQIRGLSPAPGAWFQVTGANGASERIKVLRAAPADGSGAPGTVLDGALTIACGEGAVQLLQVQRAGRRPMTAAELLRGYALLAGARVGI
jgi:methionyl-tRNA formyltransferase